MKMIRAYGLLLRLYPKDHRKVFAAEMIEVFKESAEERRERGWMAFFGFILVEAVGLIEGSALQWIATLTGRKDGPDMLPIVGQPSSTLPAEIIQVQQRIQYNLRCMEHAIAHHQFERARYFSAADQQERENLCRLWKCYGLDGEPRSSTTGKDRVVVVRRLH
jgi:hypothetical protein